jgi:drug/metabolite transporter (DMT)-like permease
MTRQSVALEYLALAAIWGSSFLFMRLGGVEFGVIPTAGVRVMIGALVLVPILLAKGQWASLRDNAAPVLFVGTLNSALPFVLFAYAVTSISTGLSGILNATVPLFGAIIALLWLRDRLGPARIAGLVIGFIGVALLAKDSASFKAGGSGWAVVACLLASLCYGYAANFTKKYLTGVHPLATAAGSQIGAALALALPTWWTWPDHNPGAGPWLALLMLGVVCSGVAYILYFRLIGHLGPARAVTVTFLVPVFAILYGTLLLGEKLTLWMLLCGAVVVLGTALATGMMRFSRESPVRDAG